MRASRRHNAPLTVSWPVFDSPPPFYRDNNGGGGSYGDAFLLYADALSVQRRWKRDAILKSRVVEVDASPAGTSPPPSQMATNDYQNRCQCQGHSLNLLASNIFALASWFKALNESGDDPSMTTKFEVPKLYSYVKILKIIVYALTCSINFKDNEVSEGTMKRAPYVCVCVCVCVSVRVSIRPSGLKILKFASLSFLGRFWFCLFYLIGLGAGFKTSTQNFEIH